MITSPSEGPVEEEGEDHVEEIVVGDVEDESNEVASKVSVSMKNHSLVVEVEGAPNMPESPIITENGKTHHLTEVNGLLSASGLARHLFDCDLESK